MVVSLRLLPTIALFLTLFVCDSRQGENEKKLLAKMFDDYEELERPVENDYDALEVQFDLTLQQIIDVDEKYQLINSNIWLNMIWFDYRLKWDPKDYGGITVINMPIKNVWRPDVLMYNSADEKFDATFPTNAVIENTGKVKWIPPGMFKSTCNINIQWFPFDEQRCELKFGSWTYDGTKLNLTLMRSSGDISAFIQNGEWNLIGMPANRTVKTYPPEDIPWLDVTYVIIIRRRALYYTFNLIVPSVILSSIALLTFTLPVESGEKISLGVTILLSLTVFLLLVADAMPPTSDAIPLIGIYFACTMMMCSLSVIFTVLVLNFHSRRPETHEMPDWVKRGICQWLAWLLRMERPGHDLSRKGLIATHNLQLQEKTSKSLLANVLDIDDDIRCIVNGMHRPASQRKSMNDYQNLYEHDQVVNHRRHSQAFIEARAELAAILRELRVITNKLREDQANDDEASDWKFAAMVIDRLCLYVFLLSTIVSTSAILLSAPNIFA